MKENNIDRAIWRLDIVSSHLYTLKNALEADDSAYAFGVQDLVSQVEDAIEILGKETAK